MPIRMILNKGRVPVKVFTNDIDHDAIAQLIDVAPLTIVYGYVAAMPDVHHGTGATVGSVSPAIRKRFARVRMAPVDGSAVPKRSANGAYVETGHLHQGLIL